MGLDKKPTPPPKRVKGDGAREESVISPKDSPEMKTEMTGEDDASHSECESNQPQDMETQVKEETAAEEDKVRDGIDTITMFDYNNNSQVQKKSLANVQFNFLFS